MDLAVVSHEMPRKTGIGRFQANVVPPLLEHEAVDPFFFQPREWYPFSMTIETIYHNYRMREQLEEYDRVFVPAQDRLTFDPRKLDAEVIPYIHDIIHGTSTFRKNRYRGWKRVVGFYLSTLQAVKYIRYNSWCETVICGSKAVKQDLLQRTGFDGKAHVIYQGVDMPQVTPVREYAYDLVYVGTLIDRKNPAFLKETLQRAVDAGYAVATVNGTPYDLPGDTYTNISERELARLYASSRYYLHPSRNEGFGRGPVEAQQFGCVPLALDTPINHEILGDEGGMWVEVTSPDDVLDQLVASRPAALVEGAQYNASQYRWKETVRQLKEVLLG